MAKKETAQVEAGKFQIIDYSEKAIALVGDTKEQRTILKQLGGKYNPNLKCGAGWVFPKTKEQIIRKLYS